MTLALILERDGCIVAFIMGVMKEEFDRLPDTAMEEDNWAVALTIIEEFGCIDTFIAADTDRLMEDKEAFG